MTVRFVPARADAMAEKPSGEDSPEYAAFERAGPGDVIVMEAMRTKRCEVQGVPKKGDIPKLGTSGGPSPLPLTLWPPKLPTTLSWHKGETPLPLKQ